MPRLTVSLEDETVGRIDALQDSLEEWRGLLATASDVGELEDARFVEQVARAIEHLGDEPSSAAVVREALAYFMGALQRAKELAELERGYEALADDEDRLSEDVILTVTREAAKAWTDEP